MCMHLISLYTSHLPFYEKKMRKSLDVNTCTQIQKQYLRKGTNKQTKKTTTKTKYWCAKSNTQLPWYITGNRVQK